MGTDSTSALVIENLSKQFGATRALQSIDFRVQRGTVHALLGHNGCGKSTLIKTLGGYHAPDEGRIYVYDAELPPKHSGADAHGAGLRFVHQDLGLVPGMSVAENLALGALYRTSTLGTISWREQNRHAGRELRKLQLDVDPRRNVEDLGPAERTLVAIARALQDVDHRSGVLVLDEPTARLPRSEVKRLLNIVKHLKSEGVAVIYVTHRLDEVFEVADEVTVLRDGQRIFSGSISDTDEGTVRSLIAGQSVAEPSKGDGPVRRDRAGKVVAELHGLSGHRTRDVNLKLYAGEMVAIVGLIGSGRSELGRLVYGLQPTISGSISLLGGAPVSNPTPRWASRAGVGYVPQERASGLAESQTIAENLAITSFRGLAGRLGVSTPKMYEMGRKVIARFGVRPGDPSVPINTLSGGNQQKIALGKWTRLDCDVLIMDEPLQGIDVGAKIDILETIRKRVLARGGAVLWLESDIEYVPAYADRVLVMRDGRIATEIASHPVSHEDVLRALYGAHSDGGHR